jgi:crotonobetainyl-CoA:carnitine CoA-transferase CaiB-like acyl-CoA transferase
MPKPLQGRVVLDCSTLLPGPRIGKILAQKGARVIKVESPSKPDRAKTLGPFYDDLNSLKEIVQLEIAPGAAGRARFEELVLQAHGLIEGFRPETKAKLGLDAETLHRINPGLCIVSLTGYPESGPWRDRPGHDMNFQALSGCLSLFDELPGLPLADLFGAQEGALSLACAMDAVARGSKGQRIEVSLFEALKDVQSSAVAIYQATGEAPKPGKTLFSGQYPCYRVYRAGCGRRVTVGAIEPKFWEQVCQVLGTPELVPQGYAVGSAGEAAAARVQAALGAKPWSHWAPLFEAAQCCVEPVLEYPEVYGSE